MSSERPYIIAGLGNPGPEYSGTRHNVGWMVIDRLAEAHGAPLELRRDGYFVGFEVEGAPVRLIKPATYVNLSGKVVGRLARELDVPVSSIVVVYDDLDMDFAALRVKEGGGSGGHRGIDSIIASLGTDDFPRVKVGIGRPPGRMEPAEFVLKRFRDDEWPEIDVTIAEAADAAVSVVTDGLEAAMNRFNRR